MAVSHLFLLCLILSPLSTHLSVKDEILVAYPDPAHNTKTYPTPLPLARKIRVFQKSSSIGLNPDRVAVSAARSGERAKNSAGGIAVTEPTPPAAA